MLTRKLAGASAVLATCVSVAFASSAAEKNSPPVINDGFIAPVKDCEALDLKCVNSLLLLMQTVGVRLISDLNAPEIKQVAPGEYIMSPPELSLDKVFARVQMKSFCFPFEKVGLPVSKPEVLNYMDNIVVLAERCATVAARGALIQTRLLRHVTEKIKEKSAPIAHLNVSAP